VALVVFLRGVNVGGHRTFRPKVLAEQLRHLDAVNVGAAGTLVIRRAVTHAELRAEIARRLSFDTEIAICKGREILGLLSADPFAGHAVRPDVVRFLSVLTRAPRSEPRLPLRLPARGPWLLKLVTRRGRYVLGMYRRHMKTIGYLGTLDRAFGVPVTTRNWNTVTAIARVLEGDATRPSHQS